MIDEIFPDIPTINYDNFYDEAEKCTMPSVSFPNIPNLNDLYRLSGLYDTFQSLTDRVGGLHEKAIRQTAAVKDLKTAYESYYATKRDVLLAIDPEVKAGANAGQKEALANQKLGPLVAYLTLVRREYDRANTLATILDHRKSRLTSATFNLKDQINTLRSMLLAGPTGALNFGDRNVVDPNAVKISGTSRT